MPTSYAVMLAVLFSALLISGFVAAIFESRRRKRNGMREHDETATRSA